MRPTPAVVLVTGLPGAGKSTLGRALAAALPGRFLSLDAIKESLADTHDDGAAWALRQAAEDRLGQALGAPAGGRPDVVDVWIQPGRDEERVLALAGDRPVVEVRCLVPADVAVERFFARERSGPHDNAAPGLEDRIRAAATVLRPLGAGPVLDVDTTGPVDVIALCGRVRALVP